MKFVDMAMSPQEASDAYASPPKPDNLPKYPYGLCISLCKDEIEKLQLDIEDCEVGEMLHLHALARVTSRSNQETEAGDNPRVEMVLAFLEIEDEDKENSEEDRITPAKKMSRLYK